MDIEEYIASHTDREPEHLHKLYRHTYLTRLYPRMCSGHYQGRLLVMLTKMIRPQRVLELGTFTGYSALCFAEGTEADARIDTVEHDDEYADELLKLFEECPGGEKITLHIGDAEDFMKGCPDETYDLVFIDANKRRYPQYYHEAVRIVKAGGYILADNTLWGSKLEENATDPQTRGIEEFNEIVSNDRRVEKVILPVRDGLTIIRKLDF